MDLTMVLQVLVMNLIMQRFVKIVKPILIVLALLMVEALSVTELI